MSSFLYRFGLAGLLSCASVSFGEDRMVPESGPRENMADGTLLKATDLPGAFAEAGFDASRPDAFYFVVISDTHVYAENERQPEGAHPVFSRPSYEDLVRLVEELNHHDPRPAFVVHAGDMVHDAKVPQFEKFRDAMSRLDPAIEQHLCIGNHDADRENFHAVFPEHQPYYSFRREPWTFVVLDSRSQGYLDHKQQEWLAGGTAAAAAGPVMFFVHYPLLPNFDGDQVDGLREAVTRAALPHSEAWVFSGHWHFNYLARIVNQEMKDLRQMVTTASTTVFGYETPGYRFVCVQGGKVVATLFKRVGEDVFRKDPNPENWPVYAAPPMSAAFRAVLGGEIPEEETFIHQQSSVGFNPQGFRFVDGNGVLVYRFPLSDARQNLRPGETLSLRIETGSDYVIETGADETGYAEAFRAPQRTTKQHLTWMIPDEVEQEQLYVRITDRTPEDGLGAFVYSISVIAEKQP